MYRYTGVPPALPRPDRGVQDLTDSVPFMVHVAHAVIDAHAAAVDGLSFHRRDSTNLVVGLPPKAHRRGLLFWADLDENTRARLFDGDYDEM